MKRDIKWIITITILSFIITLIFSFGSNTLLENVNLIIGVIIIFIFILLGIIFDIIGVAVQSSKEVAFHAMASKKVKGAKTAKKMLANSDKVSSFCNDVIGDICNIISGSAGLVVALQIANKFNITSHLFPSLVWCILSSGRTTETTDLLPYRPVNLLPTDIGTHLAIVTLIIILEIIQNELDVNHK